MDIGMTVEANRIEIVVFEGSREGSDFVDNALQEPETDGRMRVFRDGAKAIELFNVLYEDLSAPQLDLFLVDMRLPKRNGEDVPRRLRSTERYARCPVIVMTGLDSPIMEWTAMKHTAVDYFGKPSTLEEDAQFGAMIHQVRGRNARDAA